MCYRIESKPVRERPKKRGRRRRKKKKKKEKHAQVADELKVAWGEQYPCKELSNFQLFIH
jgi:hypothetical protein